MPQSQRDHGVAGGSHWLLDEELARRSAVRSPRRQLPVLLRHEDGFEPAPLAAAQPPAEPTRGPRLLVVGLLAALAFYVLLRGTSVGGALQSLLSLSGADGDTVVAAPFLGAPDARSSAGEVPALRALLAAAPNPKPSKAARPAAPESAAREAREPNRPKDALVPGVEPPPARPTLDPSSLVPRAPEAAKLLEGLKRATGLEPATPGRERLEAPLRTLSPSLVTSSPSRQAFG
jgi:hypothetical protein